MIAPEAALIPFPLRIMLFFLYLIIASSAVECFSGFFSSSVPRTNRVAGQGRGKCYQQERIFRRFSVKIPLALLRISSSITYTQGPAPAVWPIDSRYEELTYRSD